MCWIEIKWTPGSQGSRTIRDFYVPSLNACVQNKQEPLRVDEGIRRFDCLCTTASHNDNTARNLVSIMFGRKLYDKMLRFLLHFFTKSSFLPPDFQRHFQVGFERTHRRFSWGLKMCIGTRFRYVESFHGWPRWKDRLRRRFNRLETMSTMDGHTRAHLQSFRWHPDVQVSTRDSSWTWFFFCVNLRQIYVWSVKASITLNYFTSNSPEESPFLCISTHRYVLISLLLRCAQDLFWLEA